jgi:hypothetical protein
MGANRQVRFVVDGIKMSDGGTRLRQRSAKVLQLHPREVDRFSIVRDGSRIQVTIECNCEYSAMLVFDQAMDYLKEGQLVLGVSTIPFKDKIIPKRR